MIRAVSKLILAAFLGAGLMGCSDDVDRVQIQVDTSDSNNKKMIHSQITTKISYNNDTAVLTYEHDKTCIEKDSGVLVDVSFTNDTKVVLQDIWLNSLTFGQVGDRNEGQNMESFFNVSHVSFEIPKDYDVNDCAKTVSVGLHETERVIRNKIDTYSPFVPIYSPEYSFAKVPSKTLENYFTGQTSKISHQNLLFQKVDASSELLKNFRSRWTDAQVKELTRIRVAYVPYRNLEMGRVCVKGTSKCAYYDLMQSYTSSQDFSTLLRFYVPLEGGLTAQFGQSINNDFDAITTAITLEDARKIETILNAIYDLNIKD